MDKIKFGLKIRELREKMNLTQMEFAEMIDISDKALSRIEVGKVFPRLNTLIAISETANISFEALISSYKEPRSDIYIDEITELLYDMDELELEHMRDYIKLLMITLKKRELGEN